VYEFHHADQIMSNLPEPNQRFSKSTLHRKGTGYGGATGEPVSPEKHCCACYHIQIGPGTNEAAYLMGTGESFKGQRR
jgi:hypothetical protein